MKLLIEASPIEQEKPTGVNYFTEWLAKSLYDKQDESFQVGFFWLNFLARKPIKNPLMKQADSSRNVHLLRWFPQRVYAKLVSARIAHPLWLPKSDWVLFPNFYLWPLVRPTKKAVIIHDVGYIRFPEYIEEKNLAFMRRVTSRALQEADLIIANSHFTTNEMIKYGGVDKSRIVTISIPIDEEQFDKKHDRGVNRLRERYGITKKYILNLGTIEPRKDLATTVLAYCALPQKVRDTYSLVLAGKWGWKTESIRELITKKQSEGFDIITPGHIDYDDKTTFFRNASFFLLTTFYEGFGMPLLEALHCGVPSVAVDIPVLREVGGDACVWTERDPQKVSEALLALITDKKLARQMAIAGPKRSQQFSWDEVATVVKQRLLQG